MTAVTTEEHMQGEARMVLLFSGHMIDAPGRPEPRFPPQQESVAAHAIQAVLDKLHAGAEDLAICGGACGGDLLFAEAALARAVPLEVCLPFEEPAFLAASVDFAGAGWRTRYFDATRDPRTNLLVASAELGPLPPDADPYERNNLWMLERASRFGAARVQFICLWNGAGADGPGGTRHMFEQVQQAGGNVHWLDTRRLWPA